tara:strand:+ start:273 stop:911 length:639 start_codon:yes stop_codon:yes gene_type:complete
MQKNKDLYNLNKEHKEMKIKIPPNLNQEETKCFNELVKPQLEELYSYSYDNFEFDHIRISISKDKFPDNILKPSLEEIKNFLSKIPEKHLEFVSKIYFVSYHCKDDNHKEIKGRTLPIIYDVLVFPKVKEKLNIILAHEIGHIVFEKCLTIKSIRNFTKALSRTFPNVRFNSREELNHFIKEQFADCYDNFINNPERLKEFPYIYNYFIDDV